MRKGRQRWGVQRPGRVALLMLGAGCAAGNEGSARLGDYTGELRVEPGPIATVRVVQLKHPELAAGVELRCSAPEPRAGWTEQVIRRVDRAERSHRVVLTGLLPGWSYVCQAEVELGGGMQRVVFPLDTAPLPSALADVRIDPVIPGSADRSALLNLSDAAAGMHYAVLLDALGQVRWYHDLSDASGQVSVFHDADRQGVVVGGGRHQESRAPTWVGWDGEVSHALALDGVHHELQLHGEELYALIDEDAEGPLGSCVVAVEVEGGQERWRWCLEQADPELAGVGCNSLDVVGEAGQELVVLQLAGQPGVLAVERATGELAWSFRPEGDVADFDAWTEWAHDVWLLPCGEADCLLYYDNGVEAGASRIARVELDVAAGAARLQRSWTQPGWSEPRWGGVQELEGGSWLVARGHLESLAPESLGSALLEVDPEGELRWQLDLQPRTVATFRARLGPTHRGQAGAP